jgi:hypothetical protein
VAAVVTARDDDSADTVVADHFVRLTGSQFFVAKLEFVLELSAARTMTDEKRDYEADYHRCRDEPRTKIVTDVERVLFLADDHIVLSSQFLYGMCQKS